MKKGIKYCGGCNPLYDRGGYVKELKEKHPEDEWSYADEGEAYDILYVVCGCDRRCAAYKKYKADRYIIVSHTGTHES